MKYLLYLFIAIFLIAYYVVERIFKALYFIVLFLWDFKVTKDMKTMIIEVDLFIPIGSVIYNYENTKCYFSELLEIKL